MTDAAKPDLSIIVVSYGSREMTLQALRSIEQGICTVPYEVLVVDNGSRDGSPPAIAAEFPEFRLMAEPVNLGFAGACNLAARTARGKYLLLLNPDTVVRNHAIDSLLAFARRRPEAGIWGGSTLFADGTLNPMSCCRRPSLWNLFCSGVALDTRYPQSPLFGSRSYGGWDRSSEREVDIVAGCFLLIRKTLWDRLGGFSPDFFMYGEDVDLCLRARRLGFRPAFTPAAAIVHHGSGTENDQARKIRQILAARALLIRRHFPLFKRPAGLALLALRPMLGRLWAKHALRETWSEVWALRRQWMMGRF
ncbi:MAG TPA: glycosyltransferase family 2 protein [Rhizomicrobium sp.]